MQMNVFKVNPLLPDGVIALVVMTPMGVDTIWIGAMADTPEMEFNRADEAHVNERMYAQIAARAEATGKGIPVQ